MLSCKYSQTKHLYNIYFDYMVVLFNLIGYIKHGCTLKEVFTILHTPLVFLISSRISS